MGIKEKGNTLSPDRSRNITVDEEAWLLGKLEWYTEIILLLSRTSSAGHMYEQAVDGAKHGCARDILIALGMDADYENIKNLHRPRGTGTLKIGDD